MTQITVKHAEIGVGHIVEGLAPVDELATHAGTPHGGPHTHPEGDVTGLVADLGSKAPAVHAHSYEPVGAVAAHEADTTGVHGIASTGALVLTNDPRLSDARTPLAHAHNPVHTVLADGATAMGLAVNDSVRVTPTANATYTTTVPLAGSRRTILILTAGTTSRTITFGSGFKTVGTLATGTVSARVFAISFLSDGTNLYETGRTAAMVA